MGSLQERCKNRSLNQKKFKDMKIKKFTKMIKRALRSLEEKPSVFVEIVEKDYGKYYTYKFSPKSEAGFKYCAKFYAESTLDNPYRLVATLRENLDYFFIGDNFKLRRSIEKLTTEV